MLQGREIADAWRQRGRWLEVFGHRIFTVDAASGDGERGAPCLVVLHGFPTSSLDFHRCLDSLAAGRRVVLHDHLGFGFSHKPAGEAYSLLEQAEVALEVWRQLGIERADLLAHDYGTSVATEVLARRERLGIPVELESVTLANGSVHIELARLRLSQQLARSKRIGPLFSRLITRGYFRRVMSRLWGDPGSVETAELDAMWEAVEDGNGRARTSEISQYLDERFRFRRRWIGALERLDVPAHILWGRRDPIAVPAVAEALAAEIPEARLTWLDALGHYPMVEDPDVWSAAVVDFLGRPDQRRAS